MHAQIKQQFPLFSFGERGLALARKLASIPLECAGDNVDTIFIINIKNNKISRKANRLGVKQTALKQLIKS